MLSTIGLPALIALGIVVALVLYCNDVRIDLPLFFAGLALGYWGEWWGTTRGMWTYWNGHTPPDYLPPLWGIGLLTVYHLHLMLNAVGNGLRTMWSSKQRSNPHQEDCSAYGRRTPPGSARPASHWIMAGSLLVLPALTLACSATRLAAVDWSARLDAHFYAGVLIGLVLVFHRLDVQEAFSIYVCGMLLGGTYEWLGTSLREWSYITNEAPPMWIIPLWGLACVAMVKLARWSSHLIAMMLGRLFPLSTMPPPTDHPIPNRQSPIRNVDFGDCFVAPHQRRRSPQ